MRSQVIALLVSLTLGSVLAQAPENEIPEYYHLPTYIINLNQSPEMRFAQMATDLKDEINKLANDYMHLVPGFLRNFFESNMDVIKLRNIEHYREVEGISKIIGQETWVMFLLNYAFELSDVLCTSIVARQPDGSIIHGRNMDFAFPDASRNATYIAKFYRGDRYLYDAVMFGGYQGVASAYRTGAWSFTMNARGVEKSILNSFKFMGEIYIGRQDIGVVLRDVFEEVEDFETAVEALSTTQTIVPLYMILSGPGPNEGIVVTKDPNGVANVARLDDENWYIVQTNDDHFAGVCQERCQDAHEHMKQVGSENISLTTLLEDVILQSHTFNSFTIYTTMFNVKDEYFKAYGFDTDMPYVRAVPSDLNFGFF